jgi:hypothetical protein
MRSRKTKTAITPRLRLGLQFARLSPFGSLLVVLLLVLFLSPRPLCSAQQKAKPAKPYALIFGTVWGPDDHPVYGVTVKIRRGTDKPNKVRWELFSDHNGEFAQRVPAGEADYILWADLKGFKSGDGKPVRLVQPVTVHIYNDEREDMGLHLTH